MPGLDDAIHLDAVDENGFDAFLANLTGEEVKRKPEPSTETDDEAAAEVDETPAEDETPKDDSTDATKPAEKEIDPDDVEVDIKVGEETKKATIKELKRLYGQEASLTQKSQKVADTQRAAEARFSQADTALKAMLTRAQDAYKPYADLDYFVVAQQMDPEDFKALRADAAAAYANTQFFETELGQLQQANQQRAQQAYQAAAEACIKELSDPEKGIKGWNQELYGELLSFGDRMGAPNLRTVVAPVALKIVHMAMQWEKAEKARGDAERKVAAAPNKPSSVIKPGAAKAPASRTRTAMQTLRTSGSIDDAADAFLASFKS
jgi:chemotaxis protein histidine kinase CheA